VGDNKNLYQFWGNEITKALGEDMGGEGGLLVNCASQEYFKSVRTAELPAGRDPYLHEVAYRYACTCRSEPLNPKSEL
jgi:hypothetical protein